jgi:hypothetical protein
MGITRCFRFQPQILLHPSSHFCCVVSGGRLLACSQRSPSIHYAQLLGAESRILSGIEQWITQQAGGLPESMSGVRDYTLDLIVLGPPIIEADEERDCTEKPVSTTAPAQTQPVVEVESSSRPPAEKTPAHQEDGHERTHPVSGARLAPPYPYPYDIRILHVRALQPELPLGLWKWDEIQSLKAQAERPQMRTLQQPDTHVLDSTPPVWRSFLHRSCQPRSVVKPFLELLHDLLPMFLAVLAGVYVLSRWYSRREFGLMSFMIGLWCISLIHFIFFPAPEHTTKGGIDGTPATKERRLNVITQQSTRMRSMKDESSYERQDAASPISFSSASAYFPMHRVFLSTPNALFARIRQLDLTPLIRVELSPRIHMPFSPADQHKPDTTHLKGSHHIVVNCLCGPRLVLRMARYAAGSHHWRSIGSLGGAQIISLLLPHERYNFMLASKPARIVISHVGPGTAGGLYAKHALLSELHNVAFAGEMWVDEKHRVHVNNSSGTYMPKDELLPAVEQFLKQALGVDVHAHVRDEGRIGCTARIGE